MPSIGRNGHWALPIGLNAGCLQWSEREPSGNFLAIGASALQERDMTTPAPLHPLKQAHWCAQVATAA